MRDNSNRTEERNTQQNPAKPANLFTEIVFCLILLWSICSLRTIHFFSSNVGTVTFDSLGNTMWIFIISSTIAFAILRIFIKRPYFAGAYVAFCAFWAVNFTLLVGIGRVFFVEYEKSSVAALILFLILIISFIFILRLLAKKEDILVPIIKILSITFLALVLLNTALSLISLANLNKQDQSIANQPTAVPVTAAPVTAAPTAETSGLEATPEPVEPFGTPNVYIIVCDEMASFSMMEKYYDYNSDYFIDFLEQNNFNISHNSFSSETMTSYCMTDVLSLDIIERSLEDSHIKDIAEEAILPKLFEEIGYTQLTTGIWSRYWNHIPNLFADENQEMVAELEEKFGDQDAADVVEDSSILDAFQSFLTKDVDETEVDVEALNEWGFYPTDYVNRTIEHHYATDSTKYFLFVTLRVYDFLENPENIDTGYPRVLYSYQKSTHVPFVFNEYGGVLDEREERDWQDPNIYLGQYKYTIKRLMASVTNIIQNDPNAVIIVQSDHGVRFHNDCVQKHTTYITNKDSARIVNFVYIKGEKHDIEGLSAINTMRYVMSLYEGYDFPPIVDPITEESPDDLEGIIQRPRYNTLIN